MTGQSERAPMTPDQRRELMAMSPRRRIVLCLYHHENVPVSEISDIVGIPVTEVWFHIKDSAYRGHSAPKGTP